MAKKKQAIKKSSNSVKRKKKKVVRKKSTKKRITVPKKAGSEFLSSALKEIEQQLEALQDTKKKMERELYLLALDFNDTQNEENVLRDKISKLVQKESHLNTQKTKIKTDVQSLQEKINKVTQINAEMKGME